MVMNLLQKQKKIIPKKLPILKPNEPPIVGRPVTQPMGAQPQNPFNKPPPSIDPRKVPGLQPLQPSNPIVGNPVRPTGGLPTEALSLMHQNRPKPVDVDPKRNSLIPNPIIGRPVTSTMGGGAQELKSGPTPQLAPKLNPIVGQPISAMGTQAPQMQQAMLTQPPQPTVNTMAYGPPVLATNYATTAASTPTAPASAPTPNANVQAALNGMSAAMKREIERKAKAGEPLEQTTEAKRWLYSFYQGQGKGTTAPAPTAPGAQNPTGPIAKPNVAPPVNNGEANWNSNQSIPDYGAMTPEMIQALLNGYTNNPAYDPATDPAYQASLALANKQADAAGLSTMEDMNERGILNSTITSDRVGQIKQGASDAVIGNIPNFQANYNNNHHNNMNGLSNLLNTTIGAGQWQQTHAEGNRQFDKGFSLDEAQVTGSYMPAGAQSIINTVMTAKNANSQPGLSAAERAKNAEIANAGRQQLSAMGIDVSGIAGDVTYDSAVQNLPGLGRNTIIQQQTDLAKTEVMGREMNSQAQALVNTILKAKGDNEKGIGNKKANARIANEARAQLAALGFDISGIGGNVKYDQAVKNAASITGKNTLGRDELNHDARQKNADRALEQELGNKGLQLDRDKLNADTALGNRELTFREEEAKIRADLDSRGLDLDSVRNDIDMFAAESDAEYKLRQQENDVSEQEAQTNTNRAIGHIAGATSAGEAWAYIHSQTQAWADSGVDFSEVVAALESKFPGSTKSSSDDDEFDSDYGTP